MKTPRMTRFLSFLLALVFCVYLVFFLESVFELIIWALITIKNLAVYVDF